MSCSCNNTSCSDCNPCDPACPVESAACETLPSSLENFILHFFGSITRTLVNGQVIWTLPCDLATGLENNPRLADEGLACYFLRLFNDGIIGLTGPQGQTGAAGADGHFAFTVTLCEHTVVAEGANFNLEVLANPVFEAGQTVFVNGAGYATVALVTGSTMSLTMLEVTTSVGASYPIGSAVSITGPKGLAGSAAAKGDPGDQGVQGVQGDTGTTGFGAYTSVLAGYTQPAVSATVVVSVDQTETFAIGSNVFVADAGTYEVTAKTASSLTLLNLFDSPTNAAPAAAIASGKLVVNSGETGPSSDTIALIIPVTGIADALAIGTGLAYVRAPAAFTITEVRASVNVASAASGPLEIDINKNGVTILSTEINIDDTELTSLDAVIQPVISDAVVANDDIFTIDIDDEGDGAAEGLTVMIIGTTL